MASVDDFYIEIGRGGVHALAEGSDATVCGRWRRNQLHPPDREGRPFDEYLALLKCQACVDLIAQTER